MQVFFPMNDGIDGLEKMGEVCVCRFRCEEGAHRTSWWQPRFIKAHRLCVSEHRTSMRACAHDDVSRVEAFWVYVASTGRHVDRAREIGEIGRAVSSTSDVKLTGGGG